MAIELIKMIKDVEDEADQIKKKSQADAKQLTADAEKEASALLETARREADQASKKILSQAAEEAQKHFDDTMGKARVECEGIRSDAMKNLDHTVDMILRKVVS